MAAGPAVEPAAAAAYHSTTIVNPDPFGAFLYPQA